MKNTFVSHSVLVILMLSSYTSMANAATDVLPTDVNKAEFNKTTLNIPNEHDTYRWRIVNDTNMTIPQVEIMAHNSDSSHTHFITGLPPKSMSAYYQGDYWTTEHDYWKLIFAEDSSH